VRLPFRKSSNVFINVFLCGTTFISKISYFCVTDFTTPSRLTFCRSTNCNLFCSMAQQPTVGQGLLIFEASRLHSVIHTTLGRTPLVEWSTRLRDLYLTTHTKLTTEKPLCDRRNSKKTILASERKQTHASDCVATGIGKSNLYFANSYETVLIASELHGTSL